MGRFLKNLKLKTVAGAGGPSSAELRDTGKTIFLEKRNISELDELILVQRAQEIQRLNNGLLHPHILNCWYYR